ncbi:Kelch-like protein 12 [Nymphon striatum]|nr:Kelch-like protein 12 [Nymphon striatum]
MFIFIKPFRFMNMSSNSVFLEVKHSSETSQNKLKNILDFSKSNFLTDFQVEVNSRSNSDSRGTIKVNRCVLASGSSYFLEKFRENPDLNNFEINGFKFENVKTIFDFIYSDSIIINKNDLNEIFRLAKLFQLDRLLDNVKDNLNVENVLSIRDLWMSCDKLEEVKICDQFIEKNLNDISKLQIFKVIEFNYLKQLMKSNNLVVPDEKRIFEIAIEWINVDIQTRQQFGQQLMEDVRFPLMPYEFLLQIPDHELIHKNSLRRIMESVHYSNKKEFRIGQNILTSVDVTPRKYENDFANEEELNERLLCIGGDASEINRNQSCTKYDPKNKTFIELEPLPDDRYGHVATIINSQLFICGGGITQKSLISLNLMNEMENGEIENHLWREEMDLLDVRLMIYSNSCEYYCPQEDTWRPLLKMKEERCYAGSCYDNNKFIYVVGQFDVEIGQWLTLKSSIGVGRYGLTLTMFKNQIILIGGTRQEQQMLQYNPKI